jgi:hypothetical protein
MPQFDETGAFIPRAHVGCSSQNVQNEEAVKVIHMKEATLKSAVSSTMHEEQFSCSTYTRTTSRERIFASSSDNDFYIKL